MAFSKSMRKGQVPLCCNLCEIKTKINWKCIDCNLLLCQQCKVNIHPRIKGTGNHKVMDIKEAGLKTEEPDFSKLECAVHIGQGCFMYCKSCDQLVCPQCISGFHNYGHSLAEISEGYVIQVQKLQDAQNKTEIKTGMLNTEEAKIKNIEKDTKEKYTDVEKEILAQKKSLYGAVDEYIENILKDLQLHRKRSKDYIKKEKRLVIKMKEINNIKKTRLENVINSNNPEKIFKKSKDLDKQLEDKEYLLDGNSLTVEKKKDMPNFLPGRINEYNVGSLQIDKNITCRVEKIYKTEFSYVYFLTTSADYLMISNQVILQEVQEDGHNLKVISSFDIWVNDMAVTPLNDLLIASNGSVIKQIHGSTRQLQDSIYHTEQLQPRAIHVTSDYTVLIGVKNNGPTFPVMGRRAIISMDKENKNKTIYEYDSNNRCLFSIPWRITTTQTGNICVVDRLSEENRGRIVVLAQDGDVINIYTGHSSVIDKDTPFKPISIVTSPSDKIIVTDLDTNTLHILNNTGYLISHINTKDIGIQFPHSIAFTKKGLMYIGCTNMTGSTDKAELYEVNTIGL